MAKKKPSKPVEESVVAPAPPPPELVEPVRLHHGEPEGDIVGSYSADKICEGKPIRQPFSWRGGLWVCISCAGDQASAFRLMPLGSSAVTYSERAGSARRAEQARNDANGFYHGVAVKHAGQSYMLVGPEVTFVPGEVGQADMFERVDRSGSEHEARLDAERVSLEFRQKSAKRLDAGEVPFEESPLFGGPAQGDLFG